MSKPLPRTAAALALVLSASVAAAEDPTDAVVVSATRFPERLIDAPVGMTVVTAADIARSPARTLPELLAQQAGITSRTNSGSPDAQVDLRGFGITAPQNTLVLVDGQRLNEVDLSNVSWTAIPLDAIERIEIMRGSGAVMYGGGATGGTINIVTKRARPGTRAFNVAAGRGTYDTTEIRGGGALGVDGVGLTLFANRYDSDNYRRNNEVRQENLEADLRLRGARGDIGLTAAVDDQSLRLPGARTAAQVESDPRGTGTPNDFATRDGSRWALTGRLDLGAGEVAAELVRRDVRRIAFFDDYLFGGLFANFSDTDTRVWSFSPRYRLPYAAFGARHSLIVGFDYEDWEYDSRRAASKAALATPAVQLRADQRNTAGYVRHASIIAERTHLSLGGRWQRTEVSATDDGNPAPYATATQRKSVRAYELGLRHDLDQSWTAYGRLASSFRVATVDEIYDQFGGPIFDSVITPLEPQTSRDREVGLEYRAGPVRARASAYLIHLSDEIHFFAPIFRNINLPPTQREGVELDATWRIVPQLDGSFNFRAVRATFREGVIGGVDVAGNDIPLVPRVAGSLGLAWRPVDRTTATGVVRYVGRQRYDNDQSNTFPHMPRYTIVDVRLAHAVGGFTFSASVNNLFDEAYYTYGIRSLTANTFNAYPMWRRSVFLAAEYRFR